MIAKHPYIQLSHQTGAILTLTPNKSRKHKQLFCPRLPDSALAMTITKCEQTARDLAENEGLLQIAAIQIPPFHRVPISQTTPCTIGRLADTKDWFVSTPAAALISEGKVTSSWEAKAPDLDIIIQDMAQNAGDNEDYIISINESPDARAAIEGRRAL